MLEAETGEDHDSTDAKLLNIENVRIEKKLSTDVKQNSFFAHVFIYVNFFILFRKLLRRV